MISVISSKRSFPGDTIGKANNGDESVDFLDKSTTSEDHRPLDNGGGDLGLFASPTSVDISRTMDKTSNAHKDARFLDTSTKTVDHNSNGNKRCNTNNDNGGLVLFDNLATTEDEDKSTNNKVCLPFKGNLSKTIERIDHSDSKRNASNLLNDININFLEKSATSQDQGGRTNTDTAASIVRDDFSHKPSASKYRNKKDSDDDDDDDEADEKRINNAIYNDMLYKDDEIIKFLKTRVEGVKDFVSHGFSTNNSLKHNKLINKFYPKAGNTALSHGLTAKGNHVDNSTMPTGQRGIYNETLIKAHNLTENLIYLNESLDRGNDNETMANVHNFIQTLDLLMKSGSLSRSTDSETLASVHSFMKYLVAFLDKSINSSGTNVDNEASYNVPTNAVISGSQTNSGISTNTFPTEKDDMSKKTSEHLGFDQLNYQTNKIENVNEKTSQNHAFDDINYHMNVKTDRQKNKLANIGFDEINYQNNDIENMDENPSENYQSNHMENMNEKPLEKFPFDERKFQRYSMQNIKQNRSASYPFDAIIQRSNDKENVKVETLANDPFGERNYQRHNMRNIKENRSASYPFDAIIQRSNDKENIKSKTSANHSIDQRNYQRHNMQNIKEKASTSYPFDEINQRSSDKENIKSKTSANRSIDERSYQRHNMQNIKENASASYPFDEIIQRSNDKENIKSKTSANHSIDQRNYQRHNMQNIKEKASASYPFDEINQRSNDKEKSKEKKLTNIGFDEIKYSSNNIEDGKKVSTANHALDKVIFQSEHSNLLSGYRHFDSRYKELSAFNRTNKSIDPWDRLTKPVHMKPLMDRETLRKLHSDVDYIVLRCLGFDANHKQAQLNQLLRKTYQHFRKNKKYILGDSWKKSHDGFGNYSGIVDRVHTVVGNIVLPCHRLGSMQKYNHTKNHHYSPKKLYYFSRNKNVTDYLNKIVKFLSYQNQSQPGKLKLLNHRPGSETKSISKTYRTDIDEHRIGQDIVAEKADNSNKAVDHKKHARKINTKNNEDPLSREVSAGKSNQSHPDNSNRSVHHKTANNKKHARRINTNINEDPLSREVVIGKSKQSHVDNLNKSIDHETGNNKKHARKINTKINEDPLSRKVVVGKSNQSHPDNSNRSVDHKTVNNKKHARRINTKNYEDPLSREVAAGKSNQSHPDNSNRSGDLKTANNKKHARRINTKINEDPLSREVAAGKSNQSHPVNSNKLVDQETDNNKDIDNINTDVTGGIVLGNNGGKNNRTKNSSKDHESGDNKEFVGKFNTQVNDELLWWNGVQDKINISRPDNANMSVSHDYGVNTESARKINPQIKDEKSNQSLSYNSNKSRDQESSIYRESVDKVNALNNNVPLLGKVISETSNQSHSNNSNRSVDNEFVDNKKYLNNIITQVKGERFLTNLLEIVNQSRTNSSTEPFDHEPIYNRESVSKLNTHVNSEPSSWKVIIEKTNQSYTNSSNMTVDLASAESKESASMLNIQLNAQTLSENVVTEGGNHSTTQNSNKSVNHESIDNRESMSKIYGGTLSGNIIGDKRNQSHSDNSTMSLDSVPAEEKTFLNKIGKKVKEKRVTGGTEKETETRFDNQNIPINDKLPVSRVHKHHHMHDHKLMSKNSRIIYDPVIHDPTIYGPAMQQFSKKINLNNSRDEWDDSGEKELIQKNGMTKNDTENTGNKDDTEYTELYMKNFEYADDNADSNVQSKEAQDVHNRLEDEANANTETNDISDDRFGEHINAHPETDHVVVNKLRQELSARISEERKQGANSINLIGEHRDEDLHVVQMKPYEPHLGNTEYNTIDDEYRTPLYVEHPSLTSRLFGRKSHQSNFYNSTNIQDHTANGDIGYSDNVGDVVSHQTVVEQGNVPTAVANGYNPVQGDSTIVDMASHQTGAEPGMVPAAVADISNPVEVHSSFGNVPSHQTVVEQENVPTTAANGYNPVQVDSTIGDAASHQTGAEPGMVPAAVADTGDVPSPLGTMGLQHAVMDHTHNQVHLYTGPSVHYYASSDGKIHTSSTFEEGRKLAPKSTATENVGSQTKHAVRNHRRNNFGQRTRNINNHVTQNVVLQDFGNAPIGSLGEQSLSNSVLVEPGNMGNGVDIHQDTDINLSEGSSVPLIARNNYSFH